MPADIARARGLSLMGQSEGILVGFVVGVTVQRGRLFVLGPVSRVVTLSIVVAWVR